MIFSSETFSAFDDALEAHKNAGSIYGYPGRADGSGAYTFDVPSRPGYIYVRVGTNDRFALDIALNPNRVAPNPQLLVRMEYESGKLVIREANINSALSLYGANYADAYSSGERPVTEDRFYPGFVEPSSDFPAALTVKIHSLVYNDTRFPDTNQALDAYLPSTTDFFRWVKIGVRESDGAVWVSGGDEFTHATRTTALATTSKIGEIVTDPGVLVCGAVLLQEGQVAVSRTDCVSWRQFIRFDTRNNYSATTAPTVTDDESLGYGFASRWYDTVAQALYVCWDATTGAADWHLIGGSGSLSDATVSAIGALLLDESPLSGHPIALTLVRLGMWLGVAMLGGDRHVHSFHLPTNPDVSASETDRWARVGGGANPVLSGGVSWEGDAVYEPTVLIEDDTLYMFYTGGFGVSGAGAAAAIGLATAPITDPTNWTKYASNPVLGKGGSGVSGIACRNFVLKHGDLYYMYYADGAGAGANLKVATSTDKINWTVVGTALAYNAQGWMNGVANTSVWVEQGNQWKMMYEAWTGSIWKIGTATSTDGLTFTPNAANPLTDLQVGTGMYGGAYVLPQKFEGNYVLYYHAATSGNLPTRLYRALSDGDDLTSWTQYANNPVLNYGVDAFEVDQVADAHVIELLGKSYLFYDGDDNVAEEASIGLLTFDGTLAELVGGRGRTAWLQADDTLDPAILPLATSSAFGAVKPDNDTITVAAGVISAVSAAYAPLSTGDTDAPLVFDSEGRILIGRVA